MAHVLIPLADGCEELEAVTLIDLLRRAEVRVTTAALAQREVECAHGTKLVADTTLDEVKDDSFDMVVLPGGSGYAKLNGDARVHQIIKRQAQDNKLLGAICAAPKVLADAGLLEGRKATAYPGVFDDSDDRITGKAVERDGNIMTSRGPGTAIDFALSIIEAIQGKDYRQRIETALVRA